MKFCKQGDMKRTDSQRKQIWAMIDDIVNSHIVWSGQQFTNHEWEQIFTALVRHQKMVDNPNEEGSKIILGCREKELTVEEASEMILLMEVFGNEHGVKWGQWSE